MERRSRSQTRRHGDLGLGPPPAQTAGASRHASSGRLAGDLQQPLSLPYSRPPEQARTLSPDRRDRYRASYRDSGPPVTLGGAGAGPRAGSSSVPHSNSNSYNQYTHQPPYPPRPHPPASYPAPPRPDPPSSYSAPAPSASPAKGAGGGPASPEKAGPVQQVTSGCRWSHDCSSGDPVCPHHPQATHQHSLSGVKKPISGPVSATSHHQPPATQNSHFLVWIISPSSPHNLITTHHLLMNGLDTAEPGQVRSLWPRVKQPSPVARRQTYISIHLSVSCLPLQPGCGRCAMQSMRSNS